jgi:hypothetical protein
VAIRTAPSLRKPHAELEGPAEGILNNVYAYFDDGALSMRAYWCYRTFVVG